VANKGLQFEHAVMYHATVMVDNKTSDQQVAFEKASKAYASIPSDIKTKANELVQQYAPRSTDLRAKQSYYSSFEKMSGGGEEPKTDIKFESGGTKYRCSMKWGKSFQLTSAGIDKSAAVLEKVLKKTIKECGGGREDKQALAHIQAILERMTEKFENNTGTIMQSKARALMTDVRKTGGLNEQFQEVLGSRKKPHVAEVYECFKYNLTHECMTGALQFGKSSDKTATHLLTESGIVPISKAEVAKVMAVAGVRLAMKGRGRDKVTGLRRNCIVVRYEV